MTRAVRFAAARRIGEEILLSYGRIFFGAGPIVSALLLAATMIVPRVGLTGLAAVVLGAGLSRLGRLPRAALSRGLYGYNALLAGLALGAFVEPGAATPVLLLSAVLIALCAQAALEPLLAQSANLPSLTLPFVLTAWALLLIVPGFRDAQLVAEPLSSDASAALPAALALYLRGLGALFFVPRELAGAVVLVALCSYSRIAALLSLAGFAVAWAVLSQLQPELAQAGALPLVITYNAIVIAIALGGIWFVPQPSSFALAMVGALLTSLVALATTALLRPLALPALILPFNVALLLVLAAMRQRTRDGAPKAVDFAPGSPEANLNYFRTRLARFGARLGVPLRLPFYGRWTVTQGNDGAHTHQGEWRHALDFEVLDERGSPHTGLGTALTDYRCYRLPVFAAAAGTVVKVRSDVRDNPPGQRNPDLADSYGNLVLLQHGPGLFTLSAHLAPGTVEVREGQYVIVGTRLGLCGNSGRSFVPHLHFQVQASPRVGAPTAEIEFADTVIDTPSGPKLHRAALPREGEALRNLEPKDEIAALFDLPIGARLVFSVADGHGPARTETITVGIDLANTLYLESDGGHRLYYERLPHQFLAYDYVGPRDSTLYLLYAALPRVPFEAGRLRWDDVISHRQFRSRGRALLLDFLDPFVASPGRPVRLHAEREEAEFVVRGESGDGKHRAATCARFVFGLGLREVELREAGRPPRRATRVEPAPQSIVPRGAAPESQEARSAVAQARVAVAAAS